MYKSDDAEKIYYSLFKKKIPEAIQYHFNNISKEIDNNYPQDKVRKYYEVIRTVHDLEALELTARHLKKMPVLTEKFKVMIYLAETIPGNYDVFINETPKRFSVYVSMVLSAVRSMFKITKGLIISLVKKL